MPNKANKHRVIKTIGSHQPGAKRWAREYGQPLICVRHRLDEAKQQRLTTIELVVDTRAIAPRRAMVKVKLAHDDIVRRKAALAAGAIWHPTHRYWLMSAELAQALSVTDSIMSSDASAQPLDSPIDKKR